MRTTEVKLYQFEELSTEAKEKAMEENSLFWYRTCSNIYEQRSVDQ